MDCKPWIISASFTVGILMSTFATAQIDEQSNTVINAQNTLISSSNRPLTGASLLRQANKKIRNIGLVDLKKMLDSRPGMALLDVRTRRETVLTGGTIGRPQNQIFPRGWLEFRIADAVKDKNSPIVVYCGTNQRSPLAAKTLMAMGYNNVWNYPGGFFEWRKAGYAVERPDKALGTPLYSKPQKVAENVWSAIGATAPGTYENGGHNNNLSFIVTNDGVVVVNAGDNYLLAMALHEEIRKVTDQPVKYVVLENGQGHAALGSNYWKQQGAKIIAHEDTAHELEEHGEESLDRMRRRMKDKAFATRLAMPDILFDGRYVLELGGTRLELVEFGPAHSPGDIMVWIPQKKLAITGDMAFHQRLLPVFEHTDTAGWLESWKGLKALNPAIIVPGHGEPTNLAEVTKYTQGYLLYLRGKVAELIEKGGDLKAAYQIDQSPFRHLPTFRQLAKRNAGRVFRAMEFE